MSADHVASNGTSRIIADPWIWKVVEGSIRVLLEGAIPVFRRKVGGKPRTHQSV
jgi:hypothetical protein